jgi:dienelactone hydrolase
MAASRAPLILARTGWCMTIRKYILAAAALLGSTESTNAMAAGPVCDAVWHDAARERDVPVRIRMPDGGGKAPLILFSHGLGGSLDGGTLWGRAWADAGFIVIHLQHPGSDRRLLQSGGGFRMRSGAGVGGALRVAMSPEQLEARVGDVKFVLDQIPVRPAEDRCALTRIDTAHIGMSGHSFGAHTTQALAGQIFAKTTVTAIEPRITASIAFSPSPPRAGLDAQAMANIQKPFFSITGTADTTPAIPDVTAADRVRPFRVVAAVIDATTAFWRGMLMGGAAATTTLDDPKAIETFLAPGDRLERK